MSGGFTSQAFIGRADELQRLAATLERAEQGRPQLVLLAGEAGVGKTRLLLEFADQARRRGARVLAGGCVELGDLGLAYLPVVDALRGLGEEPAEAELLAEVAMTAPGLGRLLPAVARPGPMGAHGDGLDQLQVFDAVRVLLMRRSERSPLVVVLEDLHWADRATRDLVGFLARTLWSGRVTLVASYRSDELHRRHPLRPLLAELVRLPGVERLELAPFSRAELAAHLEVISGAPLPADQVERIHARSEGNPFYAEQLLAAGGEAQVQLPPTLSDVLLIPVQALSEPAQQVLGVAAVAGRRVSHRLLAQVAGSPEPDLEQGLRDAIGAGALVADTTTGTYAFRHALLQEAVYSDLLPSEQVRLHAAYARLLAAEPDGVAAELAHHCLRSHDLAGALAASVQAAKEATAVLAPAETLRHLSGALKLWDRVPDAAAVAGLDRVDLLLDAAEAASNCGEFRRAVNLARAAVAAIDAGRDRQRMAMAYERLGTYLLYVDSEGLEPVVASYRRAIELVGADPPTALRARIDAGLATALKAARRYQEARRWCDEALAVARAAGSATEETNALLTLAGLEQRLGKVDVGRSLLRQARARATAVADRTLQLKVQYRLGVLELDHGNLPAAIAALEEAVALAESSGLTWSAYGIEARLLRGYAYYQAGLWDEAERMSADLDERSPAAAELSAVALFIEIGRGRPGAAGRLARIQQLHGDKEWAAYLAGGCGVDLACWQGDLEQARARVTATLAGLAAFDEEWELSAIWPATLALAAEADGATRAQGDGDLAALAQATKAGRALLERSRMAERQARAVGRQVGPEALGWLARAEAEWTRLQGHSDPKAWQAAVEAFSYGHVYEAARCQWRLAEALLGAGQREQATVAARAAHATAVRLGAEPLQGVLEALARRGRLNLGAGLPAERTLAGLTRRELEVLRLLVEGRSNRQIAEQLFISGKTANVHVTNLLAKLGVHSRLEAAATARRLGLDRPAQQDAAT
jgi:DNA-binding CsgD family transcriptional regulator/tetratricopeptide (TPR) repeat protein